MVLRTMSNKEPATLKIFYTVTIPNYKILFKKKKNLESLTNLYYRIVPQS